MDVDKKIEELKKEHGEIAHFEVGGELVVLRTPKPGDYKKFTDRITNDKGSNAAAVEDLVLSSVVCPDRAAMRNLLERKPGLASNISIALQDLSGMNVEITISKS